LQLAWQAQSQRVRTEQMSWNLENDLVAYSVQNASDGWRWRVYAAHGRVIRHGLEHDESGALRAAVEAFCGGGQHQLAA